MSTLTWTPKPTYGKKFPLGLFYDLLDWLDAKTYTPKMVIVLTTLVEIIIWSIPALVAIAVGVPIWGTYVMIVAIVGPGLLGITLLAHRSETHHSIGLHPIIAYWLRTSIFVASGMKISEWVAVHLTHHKYSDELLDPHSPKQLGIWHVFFLTGKYFRYAKTYHPAVLALIKQFRGELNWANRNIFEGRFVILGPLVYLPLVQLGIGTLCMGLHASLLIFLFTWPYAVLYFLHAGGTINAWGHAAEAISATTNDYSINLGAAATVATLGEGQHWNHHLDPTRPRFGKWDIGYWIACILQVFHLAKINSVLTV